MTQVPTLARSSSSWWAPPVVLVLLSGDHARFVPVPQRGQKNPARGGAVTEEGRHPAAQCAPVLRLHGGEVIGSMGVSSAEGEKCPSRNRRGVQETGNPARAVGQTFVRPRLTHQHNERIPRRAARSRQASLAQPRGKIWGRPLRLVTPSCFGEWAAEFSVPGCRAPTVPSWGNIMAEGRPA